MTDQSDLQSSEDIILPVPKVEELPKLRLKLKHSKPPFLPADANWSNSKIGFFETKNSCDGVVVTWATIDGPEYTALFDLLGVDPALESRRLDLGWMIANMARTEAIRVLHIISDPKQAMAEAARFRKEEECWRYWALCGNTTSKESFS